MRAESLIKVFKLLLPPSWYSQSRLTGLEKHDALSKTLNANLANEANCANFSGFIGDIRLFAAFALKILEKISDFEKAMVLIVLWLSPFFDKMLYLIKSKQWVK